ncbi:right-handed parallel beta-helix repeat-containing protein [Lacticaseibacillus kribbianus]|uniref:right-handed parallel beta-helix repeat-containing protein n=1 Tax=Lacticaseibacillus kribbianus TaxID=2926292 RepID=UPI001CD34BF0|nr:right-handed parallel beta-helix repeat-containing protein [Lacticaseibacillus kribbianus]
MEYHVSINGADSAAGSAQAPWRHINYAAQRAVAGDTVVVHGGTYRERVDPRFGGLSDRQRITYLAAPGEHPRILGSEVVTGWRALGDGLYTATVDNALFGDFNPFACALAGDWLNSGDSRVTHRGAVFVDGQTYYEAQSLDALRAAAPRKTVHDYMTGEEVPEPFPAATARQWFAQVTANATTFTLNGQGVDLTRALVEVTVRATVFTPSRANRNFITVRGFELAQAATPWNPPTVAQVGLIGPNWSRGWVIEDNVLHDAKTSAISLGKDTSTGDAHGPWRPSYHHQLEAVFTAREYGGWDKARIGSHVVRRNTIHDCGQNGICGHLGAVFSTIADNHIYNIGLMREFWGWECAAIKLHAAIDVQIRHNRIHDTVLGLWLDWEAQGTRVSANVFYRNCRGVFVEVSHGPYLVDNNVIIGPRAIENFSQGGAFVHNLLSGTYWQLPVLDRFTPYHRPHTTAVAGYSAIYGGDDRFLRNLYATASDRPLRDQGTAQLAGRPDSLTAFQQAATAADTWPADLAGYQKVSQPVYLAGNAYCGGVQPAPQETGAVVVADGLALALHETPTTVTLTLTLPAAVAQDVAPALATHDLPPVQLAHCDFEGPDGSDVVFDRDLTGLQAPTRIAGPLAGLHAGQNVVTIWNAAALG